jgi:hypothetical protein
MTSTRVQFRVGDFQCIAIKDGTFPYPTDWFFSNVRKAQLEDYDLGLSHIVGSYTCLLVKTGKHMLLVDTGAGIAVNEYLEKDGLAPTSGDLLKHLSADGIARE